MTTLPSVPAPTTSTAPIASTVSVAPPRRGNRVRWNIPARLRKSILVTHVVSAGAWIGIDVISVVLVAIGWVRAGEDRTAAYRALADFFVVPLLLSALVAGTLCLITGVLLGWATKWGLIRYWWVAVKLVLNAVACAMMLAFLGPVTELATGEQPLQDIWFVSFLGATALALLSFATVLSIFKPWGRPWGRVRR